MELSAAIDLHSNNGYCGIINSEGKRIFHKKISNDLSLFLGILQPFKKEIKGLVVESTYNWYWLVDGLMENGYKVHLANPAAIQQYDGLKHADDKSDAFFLAELLRLEILPEGYIYPKEERAIRDLLRKRMMLVRQRTSHILSFQSLVNRQTGMGITSNTIKQIHEENVEEIFENDDVVLSGETNISVIRFLTEKIKTLEKSILKRARLKKEYKNLLTGPGIGKILALTIMLETGYIKRFAGAGNYASYCRCVKSNRLSNNKKKGSGNKKNGNKYLGWAYIEAANFAKRFSPAARKYYQKKMSKTNQIVATKALACKLAKACYYIMRGQEVFTAEKIFG